MNEWEWNLLEDKTSTVSDVEIDGIAVKVGDRVRLRPKEGGDILDLALRGQVAIIESIEEDYEGTQHICVVIEDDPGRDLGMMRQPGHRFFFTLAEIEPLPQAAPTLEDETANRKTIKPRILIAGIGNIFLGDDAFGVEVVRRLMNRNLPCRGPHRRLWHSRPRSRIRPPGQLPDHDSYRCISSRPNSGNRFRRRAEYKGDRLRARESR